MDDVLTLELPFPPKELSPNSRPNRWEKARTVRQYREDCGWAGTVQYRRYVSKKGTPLPTLTPPVTATVTFVVPDRRRRDEQNFLQMLKPAFDGLVDAGVLQDDNHEVFKVVATHFEVGEPKVIVELRSGAGTTQ